jgi:hypothetical protein
MNAHTAMPTTRGEAFAEDLLTIQAVPLSRPVLLWVNLLPVVLALLAAGLAVMLPPR